MTNQHILPQRPAVTDYASMGYVCLPVPPEARDLLMRLVTPQYPKVKADHITLKFGLTQNTPEAIQLIHRFASTHIEIYGTADDRYGLQCLLARVNGKKQDEEGRSYHVTWSLNPKLDAPHGYNPDGKPGKIEARHSNHIAQIADFITVWPESAVISFVSNARFQEKNARPVAITESNMNL